MFFQVYPEYSTYGWVLYGEWQLNYELENNDYLMLGIQTTEKQLLNAVYYE
jgi:hypothetical protein